MNFKNFNLLYVDDDIESQKQLNSIFEILFKQVILAKDGVDGLEKFKKHNIDIIITDINMPIMNGLEMSKQIKEIASAIPIIVLSAFTETRYFINCIDMNISDYLLKPINMKQLKQSLTKALEKLELQNELNKNVNFLKQYQDITDSISIVSKVDINGNISYVNDKFCEISKYTKEELIGKEHHLLITQEDVWQTLKNKKIYRGILKNTSKNKRDYFVKVVAKPIFDIDNNISEYIILMDDITDIMNPQKLMEDSLEAFEEPVVIFIQIDDYDNITRYYGSQITKKIQEKFLHVIYEYLPKDCEFAKVYALNDGRYALTKDKKLCTIGESNVIKNFKEFQSKIDNCKLNVEGFNYDISVIVSFAYGDKALENANFGISRLMQSGKKFILANNLLQKEYEQISGHFKVLNTIKTALNTQNIISFFQPIVDNKTKEVVKYESLVRLIDENEKVLTPYFFLDVAKKAKYYSQVTDIVLTNSFEALHLTDKKISINLSIQDIEKKSTRNHIFNLLKKYKNEAHRIIFELLEDEEVKDYEVIELFISQIKTYGILIAIDDFGTGYSSFARIMQYKPDILKIDASLIKNILTDNFSLNVVKAIVAFAKAQNIELVAEYVENEEIFILVNKLGIQYSQGYYFGKPSKI